MKIQPFTVSGLEMKCPVTCVVSFAFALAAAATPETSKLFVKYVDPSSGVTSWMLKPGMIDENQQSIYFTSKSMTDDGRFLVLDVS